MEKCSPVLNVTFDGDMFFYELSVNQTANEPRFPNVHVSASSSIIPLSCSALINCLQMISPFCSDWVRYLQASAGAVVLVTVHAIAVPKCPHALNSSGCWESDGEGDMFTHWMRWAKLNDSAGKF